MDAVPVARVVLAEGELAEDLVAAAPQRAHHGEPGAVVEADRGQAVIRLGYVDLLRALGRPLLVR